MNNDNVEVGTDKEEFKSGDVFWRNGVPEELKLDEASFERMISEKFLEGRTSQEKPTCYILVGQCGAGKSTLERAVIRKFNNDIVVVDTDTIRSCHPKDKEFYERHPIDYVLATKHFVGKWATYVMDTAINNKNNLLIHELFRHPERAMGLLERLKESGFGNLKICIISVNRYISEASTIQRYNLGVLDQGLGRFIDPELHNDAYKKMLETLQEVHISGLADIEVYTRNKELLYKNEIIHENGKVYQNITVVDIKSFLESGKLSHSTIKIAQDNKSLLEEHSPSNTINDHREAPMSQKQYTDFMEYTKKAVLDSRQVKEFELPKGIRGPENEERLKEIRKTIKAKYTKYAPKVSLSSNQKLTSRGLSI